MRNGGTGRGNNRGAGRKDRADAMLVFNQSLALAASCALLTLLRSLVDVAEEANV